MTAVQLSLFIQSCIIRLLIDQQSNLHEDKDTYKGNEYWYIVFNGEKRRQQPIKAINVIDIALVSKWWLQVVRQRSSVYFKGHLDTVILKSIHSSNHSIYSSNSIQTLKWALQGLDHYTKSTFNYEKQLMQLLPHLQSINLLCKGNVNIQVLEALRAIQKQQYPHIVINTEFDLNGIDSIDHSFIEWPASLEGFTPNTVSLGTCDFNPWGFFHENSYQDNFIDMIKDLQPRSLNLYTNSGQNVGVPHIKYSDLFKHLTSIKHLNIGYDFVEFAELKHLVDVNHYMQLESLKVDIVSRVLLVHPFSDSSYHYNTSMDDWIEFCDYQQDSFYFEPVKLNTFQLAFESIWSGGDSKIDYLALECMPNVMTDNMWNILGNCQSITKLLLTHETVTNEMVPSLANLLSTNTTITVLSIRGNELSWSNDLAEAFKQNKTITVLDIGKNFCKDYDDVDDTYSFLNALLYSDTVQYLFLHSQSQDRLEIIKGSPYYIQSKSLKEFNLDFISVNDSPYFNNITTKNQR
ncbi:hypothetical protein DFA_05046 [Cavenderia fasciculata]|uniref:Uncharacterized protein n=1 Tax=Cavenderia fasciculata TaxID=261658 RepID=F4PN23_CACFS|nr:uncharacterized protein DFA_05046 [Cavenderia fasciculata]EGG22916.1 hypothetical protein DFA_05046 [Cavenderia fasciculata]|eukprot:XP_004360767.1 hypothetical protein DFA_05046 [Cavenderia fasciculata]